MEGTQVFPSQFDEDIYRWSPTWLISPCVGHTVELYVLPRARDMTSVLIGLVPPRKHYMIYIEDQAFSPPYDLAPPHPLPPSPVSKLSLFLSLSVCRQSSFLTRGGGEGEG